MSLTIFLQGGGSTSTSLLYFLAMFVILYFFMIRPQIQRQKKEKSFQASLNKGAKVITTSGIHGKIVELNDNDNTCIIETSAGRIKFERSAISLEMTKKLQNPKVKK